MKKSSESLFVDHADVVVEAGRGGDGIVSFRREKFVEKGGPNGGDGGNGGDVVFKSDSNLNTLAKFRYHQRLRAGDGKAGRRARKHGKNGDDLIVEVPVGTVVYQGTKAIADLSSPGQEVTVAYGGKGGFGNAHFKSSVRRSPRVAEKGEPGERSELKLELKVLADVGIIGLPNAGKSTLLSVISNARPEIADYAFTTTVPNLGVADVNGDSLLLADIPGLIEGASHGKGLGDEFLRHIERTAVLIHLIDIYHDNVAAAYKTITAELKSYTVDLSQKSQIIALTKAEGLDEELINEQRQQLKKADIKHEIHVISSVAHIGLEELLRSAHKAVTDYRQKEAKLTGGKLGSTLVLEISDENAWQVAKKHSTFIVSGKKIEGFARRTDFDSEPGIARLKDIMRKMGIMNELTKKGAKSGSRVRFGDDKRNKLVL